jgi:hypothetical protein
MGCRQVLCRIEIRDLRQDFWEKFQECLGSHLNFSMSAHLKTDG